MRRAVMARQHVQLQALVNRVVHILDGSSIGSANSEASALYDPPLGTSLKSTVLNYIHFERILTCTCQIQGLFFSLRGCCCRAEEGWELDVKELQNC
jgi:hypothetical protein